MILFKTPGPINGDGTVKRGGIGLFLSVLVGFCVLPIISHAVDEVPQPFQPHDPQSKYAINYDVLTNWLKSFVIDVGPSSRKIARPAEARFGTRIKPKIERTTSTEGNRFLYESFQGNEKSRKLVESIRQNLERIPDKVPLAKLSRNEQLAYWLNLYNVTVLHEIIAVYPEDDLQDILMGDQSFLSKKLLKVSGVELSLNDIENTILKQNYGNNPLILYGLYQGMIGGPNIRRNAYTGADVYRALQDNAVEFVNSNRGTFVPRDQTGVLQVSSLYERNHIWFPDFDTDLTTHLLTYIEGPERMVLQGNPKLVPDIDNWSVTDVHGTYPEVRNGVALSPAGLIGAYSSSAGNPSPINGMGVPGQGLAMLLPNMKYSPEKIKHLMEINTKIINSNRKKGTVTIEELGQVDEPDQQ